MLLEFESIWPPILENTYAYVTPEIFGVELAMYASFWRILKGFCLTLSLKYSNGWWREYLAKCLSKMLQTTIKYLYVRINRIQISPKIQKPGDRQFYVQDRPFSSTKMEYKPQKCVKYFSLKLLKMSVKICRYLKHFSEFSFLSRRSGHPYGRPGDLVCIPGGGGGGTWYILG